MVEVNVQIVRTVKKFLKTLGEQGELGDIPKKVRNSLFFFPGLFTSMLLSVRKMSYVIHFHILDGERLTAPADVEAINIAAR